MIEMPLPDFSAFEDEAELENEAQESETHSITHIKPSELVEMMRNDSIEVVLIDCRFDYEYNAGHIHGARSVNWPNEIDHYFTNIGENQDICFENVAIVFYCEYSQNRGPTMASIFRRIDRSLNYKRYPCVYYENVFILQGGFKNFYRHYPKFCEGSHFPMWDKPGFVNYNMKKRENMINNLIGCKENEIERKTQFNEDIHFSLSQPIFLKI